MRNLYRKQWSKLEHNAHHRSVEAGPWCLILDQYGTDLFAVLAALQSISKDELSIRLYPTNLESTGNSTAGGRQIDFRGVGEVTSGFQDHRVFSSCGTWFGVDGDTWGNYPVDELIFSLSDDGNKAVRVTPGFLKVNLERSG
jgi:hypothetical protein